MANTEPQAQTPAHAPQTYPFPMPDFVDELRFAHRIIRNALRVMTVEQKARWAELNHIDEVDGEGATRAKERLALFSQTPDVLLVEATPTSHLPPHVAYVGNWLYVTRERFSKRTKPREGYLMAIGLGVNSTMLVSTADPAWRLLELDRSISTTEQKYADGCVPANRRSAAMTFSMMEARQFDRVAISVPMNDAHQLACDFVEMQTGQRQRRLLYEPLEKVVALPSEKIGGAA